MNEIVTSSDRYDRREAEVLEAALEVFAELGFRKASVEDIAAKLGLSAGALYRYAADKRDLYKKATRRGFELWQAAVLEAVARETDPIGRFRVACGSAFNYLAEEPRLRKILVRDPALFPFFEADDPFSGINQASVGLLESLIREGAEAGVFSTKSDKDIKAAARVIFSLYVMFVQKAYVAGESDEALLFERTVDLLLDGLKKR